MTYRVPTAAELMNMRQAAEEKVSSARNNLLLMIVLSAVNLVLLAVGANVMLLFSATIPYLLASVAMELGALGAGVVLALILLALYLVCWGLSKRHYGWMVAALVMFLLDTVAMALLYLSMREFGGIMDVIFHIWVMYYLVMGVIAGHQLRTLPEPSPEEVAALLSTDSTAAPAPADTGETVIEQQQPLRLAEEDVKYRVLLEADALGRHVVYRRVKKVNQLVIDRYIYDEVSMLMEGPHSLCATVDGHIITVGYDGFRSYIQADDQVVARKVRLI